MITTLTRPQQNTLDFAHLAPHNDAPSQRLPSNMVLLSLVFKVGGEEVLNQLRARLDAPDNNEFKERFQRLQTEHPPQVVAHWVHGISLVGWNLDKDEARVLEDAKTKGHAEIAQWEKHLKCVETLRGNGSGFFNPVTEEAVKAYEASIK